MTDPIEAGGAPRADAVDGAGGVVGDAHFHADVQAGERGRVFIRIPFDPAQRWGSRGRAYVRGTIAGHPVDGSLGVRAGEVFLPLSKPWRSAAGVEIGQSVAVRLAPRSQAPRRRAVVARPSAVRVRKSHYGLR